ncbi:transglycosylase family protein [Embleya sp. AB8]|uniref:transglycosylase family protein n=1 Tax=Embleya sp. AB8 TaxID=3156304 RepID=UPI003C715115
MPAPAVRRLLAGAALTITALATLSAAPADAASVATWDNVAHCESTDNWSINIGNGYYGGLQINMTNWRYYGGLGYAPRPDLATKQQQILIAEKILADQGYRAWTCWPGTGLDTDRANPYPGDTPAPTPVWRSQVLVDAGGTLYHATRYADGGWTGFGDVQAVSGSVPGGIRASAEAGINGDTHILAVSGDGKLRHTIRTGNGSWGAFGTVDNGQVPAGTITNVAAASFGSDLFVTVVADGRVFNTVRHADGTWSGFADVSAQMTAPIGTVSKVATANIGGRLQVLAVSGGAVYHAIRDTNGVWTGWNNTASALRNIGPVSDIAVAGTGGDLQIVATANNGAAQYHGVRYANGTWQDWADLGSVLGPVTVTNVSAANVAGELQVGVVATDNRILHTIRRTNGTWDGAGAINLSGVTGDHTGINLTGTLS